MDLRCDAHRRTRYPSLLSYFTNHHVTKLVKVLRWKEEKVNGFFLPRVVRRVRGGQVTLAAFRLHCAAVCPVRVWCEKGGRKCGEGDWRGVS